MRARLIASALLLTLGRSAFAASLDVTSQYRLKGIDYENLNINSASPNSHSYLENDARLGVSVSKIYLETKGAEDTTMDVAVLLHALGATSSSGTIASSPLDQPAANYPSSNLTPFIENAYIRVHNLFGKPIQATFGRQNFRLGSGLLLDDDGAGFTGVVIKSDLGFWDMKSQFFIFSDRDNRFDGISFTPPGTSGPPPIPGAAPGTLDLYGFSFMLPTDGTWELNQLFERDRAIEPIIGCSFTDPNGNTDPCMVGKALRSFTDARYMINYGPMVFDGEAALEKGAANPTGPTPAPNHITFNGNAEVVRAKWRQSLYRTGEGIARVSLARGSGQTPGVNRTTDSAFMPSHGHRFDGLDRSGFGDFFNATPYDAFGGNYSSTTVSGLRQGASGIIVVGMGYTPPAFHGVAFDLDYYLFRADRVLGGPSTLGWEWDLRLRYNIEDHFQLAVGDDIFTAGAASNPARGTSHKYTFEASGRF